MARRTVTPISELGHHPDLEVLRDYDHPPASLRRWQATLTAMAWLGEELACFFVGDELAERYVVLFHASKDYRPRFCGIDMRKAAIGESFELDVFVASRTKPIVDAAMPVQVF